MPEPAQAADEQEYLEEQVAIEDQEPEAEFETEYAVETETETDAETETEAVTADVDAEPEAESDEQPSDQTEDQSDEQAEVDVFGFERQQGTSLRSIISETRDESDRPTSSSTTPPMPQLDQALQPLGPETAHR